MNEKPLSERMKATDPMRLGGGAIMVQWIDEVASLETAIASLQAEVETVCDILADYDGYRTQEGLMGLIDEVRNRLLALLSKEGE